MRPSTWGGTLARYAAPGARGGLRHGDRTYRTQVPPTDALLKLSAEELGQLSSTEDLTLRVGSAAVDPEDDLFAGIGDDGPAAAP